jgi:biofilm PGA synthesis N-glycosyltransferase PgaC
MTESTLSSQRVGEKRAQLEKPVAARWLTAAAAAVPVAATAAAFLLDGLFWPLFGIAISSLGVFGHFLLFIPPLKLSSLRHSARPRAAELRTWPSVTLLIAAHNEEKVIRRKVENALALTYPGDLRIVVASDGSQDATDAIVAEFAGAGVQLFRNDPRTGKAGLLRRASAAVSSEIIVLSDANAFYLPGAVTELVRRFADPTVGAVTGNVRLTEARAGAGAEEEEEEEEEEEVWLWGLERRLLELESAAGSCVGVDGAMAAVRRPLLPAYRDGTILDDLVLGVSVANQGYRVVYEPAARGWEASSPTLRGEYERRARILAGIVQLYVWGIGLPLKGSGLLWRFFGHKVWRWLAPIFSLCLAANILALLGPAAGAAALLGGFALLFLGLAAWNGFQTACRKLGSLCVFQMATFAGLYRGIARRQSGAWRRTER